MSINDRGDGEEGNEPEVDRIRDIIFGGQMRDYDQRFRAMQRDLDQLQESLDALRQQLAESDGSMTKRVQSLRDELREADGMLRAELRQASQELGRDKVARAEMATLLQGIAARLMADDGAAESRNDLEAATRAPAKRAGRKG